MDFADYNINQYYHPWLQQFPNMRPYIKTALGGPEAVMPTLLTGAEQFMPHYLEAAQPGLEHGLNMLGPSVGSQRGGMSGAGEAFMGRYLADVTNQGLLNYMNLGSRFAPTTQGLAQMMYATDPTITETPDPGLLDYAAQMFMPGLQNIAGQGLGWLGQQGWNWLTGTPGQQQLGTPQQTGGGGISASDAATAIGGGYSAYQGLSGPAISVPGASPYSGLGMDMTATDLSSMGQGPAPYTGQYETGLTTDPQMYRVDPAAPTVAPTAGVGAGAGGTFTATGAEAAYAGLSPGAGTLSQSFAASPAGTTLGLIGAGLTAYTAGRMMTEGTEKTAVGANVMAKVGEAYLTGDTSKIDMHDVGNVANFHGLPEYSPEGVMAWFESTIPRQWIARFGKEEAGRMWANHHANYTFRDYDPATGYSLGEMIT